MDAGYPLQHCWASQQWHPAKGTEQRQSFFNGIQSKHIDFVLCALDDVRLVLAMELDDSSHQRTNRQSRDASVD